MPKFSGEIILFYIFLTTYSYKISMPNRNLN